MDKSSSGYKDETDQDIQYKQDETLYSYEYGRLTSSVSSLKDENGIEVLKKNITYGYDDNGNNIDETTTYIQPSANISKTIKKVSNEFDGFNRLKISNITEDNSNISVKYRYDGQDTRRSKTVEKDGDLDTTNYIYDRGKVVLESDGNNSLIAQYITGNGYIGQVDKNNKTSYFIYNSHGDVMQTVGTDGAVENQYDYDIFGNITFSDEQYTMPIRYSGQLYDDETNLHYLNARYYNSSSGRFISEDSYLGEDNQPLSLNRYTYCNNNPIKYIDPSWHFPFAIGAIGGLGGTIAGGSVLAQ